MEEKIRTDLLKIKEFLENRHFDYKIVGSLALQVCGISMGREPEDIDIEVVCEQSQEQIFKALAEQYGSNFHDSKEYNISDCEHKPYIFEFGGTKINVWCLRKFTSNNYVQHNGIKYGTVMDVLSKKMAYRRTKDYKDLLNIISGLTALTDVKQQIDLKKFEGIVRTSGVEIENGILRKCVIEEFKNYENRSNEGAN